MRIPVFDSNSIKEINNRSLISAIFEVLIFNEPFINSKLHRHWPFLLILFPKIVIFPISESL